jgi:hypothetical protein
MKSFIMCTQPNAVKPPFFFLFWVKKCSRKKLLEKEPESDVSKAWNTKPSGIHMRNHNLTSAKSKTTLQ